MSENRSRRDRDFSMYDTMTTEALEEILRLDAEDPQGQASDGELLLYVMEVLAKRKQNSDNPGKTAQKAWESFQQHYLPEEESCAPQIHKEKKPVKSFNPWLRRLTAAAAVIVLVLGLSATANAFGWQDIWNAVAKWAKETFSFVTEDNPQDTEPATDDVRQYRTLQEALTNFGEECDFVPKWIPESYTLDDIRTDESPIRKNYSAFYRNGEKVIRISVQSYMEADPEKIEVKGDLLEIYEVFGTEYHIFRNNELICAAWIKESYECYISGDLTVEEIKSMIDSIGKG